MVLKMFMVGIESYEDIFLYFYEFGNMKIIFDFGFDSPRQWVLMMLFQPELGWSVLELLGRSADSGCRAPLQKQETKGSAGARPLPLQCLSQFFPVGEKIDFLENGVLCVPFTDGVAWYLYQVTFLI